jgi:hypothetical protein
MEKAAGLSYRRSPPSDLMVAPHESWGEPTLPDPELIRVELVISAGETLN